MTDQQTQKRLNQLAWFLDNSIVLPGTRYRIGVDALFGLVPGLGDLLGTILSSYIVWEAVRLNLPRGLLFRLFFNVAVESIAGMLPIFGDIFDAAWKANQRNVDLLNAYLDHPQKTVAQNRSSLFGILALLVALLVFTFIGAGWLLYQMAQIFWGG